MKNLNRYGVWALVVISILIFFTGIFKWVASFYEEKKPTISSSDRIKGSLEAKAIVLEYSDFQCPACKLYQPMVKQLADEYKDKIAFVYRHFPLPQHRNAQVAAYAAESAGNQGKFWEMESMLFENQEEWAEKGNADEIFRSYAVKLGLNQDKFSEDMKSAAVREKVDRDKQSGEEIRVNATPTFYVNGIKIRDIRNYDDLKRIVEEKLQSQ